MDVSKYYLNPEPEKALEWYTGLDFEGRRNARGFMSAVFCSDYEKLKKCFNYLDEKGDKEAAGWFAIYASYNPYLFSTIPTIWQKVKFCFLCFGVFFFLKCLIGHRSLSWCIGDFPRSPQEIDMNFAAFSGTGDTEYLAANLCKAFQIMKKGKPSKNDVLLLSCLTWAFISLSKQDSFIKAYLERQCTVSGKPFIDFVLKGAERSGFEINLGKAD